MSEIEKWTLLLNLAATFTMVGVIWFVQVVHYPLFSQVGRAEFARYETNHQRLTSWVVGPPMLTELSTATLLLWWRPSGLPTSALWASLGLLLSIWAMTYAVQVPQHASLAQSYDDGVQRRLVLGNWYRTVAWSARGVLVLWMVGQVIISAPSSPAGEFVKATMP